MLMQMQRLHIQLEGLVQGIGFRPFVYRLALDLRLSGWVANNGLGVIIEAEGGKEQVNIFMQRLQQEAPPHAYIARIQVDQRPPAGFKQFELKPSVTQSKKSFYALPDIATCPDCLTELFDPADRRYRYPFISCCHCGPRYSIMHGLPYDRARTTMDRFILCEPCQAEYRDPADRRFHAQTTACPACGPKLRLWNNRGNELAEMDEALRLSVEAIGDGAIVAVKGIGGFQLLVDARHDQAVRRLRQRKARPDKPFAAMFPSLEAVKLYCKVSPLEEKLLLSPAAPIVLLRQNQAHLAAGVAPRNPYVGAMLPYSPLHHLLLNDLKTPVVATSGNLSSEPICTDEGEALTRLKGIADLFLIHDRPIIRPLDDSLARVIAGQEMLLRRARGYAPLPITLAKSVGRLLALGGHLKNTIALSDDRQVILSQHLGDLDTLPALTHFRNAIQDLCGFYAVTPHSAVCDEHPDYASSQQAASLSLPVQKIQHHDAHVSACMAEHGLQGDVLGIAWDGAGLGTDHTLWGGEFFRAGEDSCERIAHLRPFPLPGGEKAIKEPRRAALGLLYALFHSDLFAKTDLAPIAAFNQEALSILRKMLERGLNAPLCSSAGRLFDAVASLLGLCQTSSFEGQAAMALEFSCLDHASELSYPFRLIEQAANLTLIDWQPMILALLQERAQNLPPGFLAAKFHNTLADMIVTLAQKYPLKRVVLSGGCFQNKHLSERAIERLRQEGFQPFWHKTVPPNDGGLALGQIVAASRIRRAHQPPSNK